MRVVYHDVYRVEHASGQAWVGHDAIEGGDPKKKQLALERVLLIRDSSVAIIVIITL